MASNERLWPANLLSHLSVNPPEPMTSSPHPMVEKLLALTSWSSVLLVNSVLPPKMTAESSSSRIIGPTLSSVVSFMLRVPEALIVPPKMDDPIDSMCPLISMVKPVSPYTIIFRCWKSAAVRQILSCPTLSMLISLRETG